MKQGSSFDKNINEIDDVGSAEMQVSCDAECQNPEQCILVYCNLRDQTQQAAVTNNINNATRVSMTVHCKRPVLLSAKKLK